MIHHLLDSGTWDLAPRKHEGGGMRYLRARRRLIELLDAHRVTALAFEDVRRHAGTTAAHVYGGVVAMVQAVAEERACPYLAIPVAAVKRFATGAGRADKQAMIDAAAARFGRRPRTADEADAIWIAVALSAEVGQPGLYLGIDPGTACGWALLRVPA